MESDVTQPEVEAPAVTDPILGRAVGNYVIDKKLGAGGMGSVYRLRHRELPNTFQALKVLADSAGQSARDRFKQEALVAATIGSHRVVKPLDIGQFDDGVPYIVMEYVPGHSLEETLAVRGPLPVATALRIAVRVADTMLLAHNAGIVHRDLKPANLMLLPDGEEDFQVKLLDFGIARATGDIKVARTAEHVVMGTPGYWSPEQVSGNRSDGRSDAFSLGVILFEMLTGELPFPAATVEAAMMSALSNTPAPPPSSRRPEGRGPVPRNVDELASHVLAKDRDQRLDMAGLHAELTAALSRSGSARLASVAVPLRLSPHEVPTLAPSSEKPLLFDLPQVEDATSSSPLDEDADTARDAKAPESLATVSEAPPRSRRHLFIGGAAAMVVALVTGGWAVLRRPVASSVVVPPKVEKPMLSTPDKVVAPADPGRASMPPSLQVGGVEPPSMSVPANTAGNLPNTRRESAHTKKKPSKVLSPEPELNRLLKEMREESP